MRAPFRRRRSARRYTRRVSFARRLHDRIRQTDSRVCLGIDPRPAEHPATHPDAFDGDPARVARAVVTYFREILGATHEALACVKLQSAFFEALGVTGIVALAQLVADVKALGLPLILDAKRGDIGSTARAYADAYLGDGVFGADALTVNPYLGVDALEPFLRASRENDRGIFVLVRTSNPGASDFQDLPLAGGGTLAETVAARLTELAREGLDEEGYSPVGAVVGATSPRELRSLRAALPHSVLLVPGYGAQGGTAGDVAGAFRDGVGAVVSSSRALTYVGPEDGWAARAGDAARRMRDDINAALG